MPINKTGINWVKDKGRRGTESRQGDREKDTRRQLRAAAVSDGVSLQISRSCWSSVDVRHHSALFCMRGWGGFFSSFTAPSERWRRFRLQMKTFEFYFEGEPFFKIKCSGYSNDRTPLGVHKDGRHYDVAQNDCPLVVGRIMGHKLRPFQCHQGEHGPTRKCIFPPNVVSVISDRF